MPVGTRGGVGGCLWTWECRVGGVGENLFVGTRGGVKGERCLWGPYEWERGRGLSACGGFMPLKRKVCVKCEHCS